MTQKNKIWIFSILIILVLPCIYFSAVSAIYFVWMSAFTNANLEELWHKFFTWCSISGIFILLEIWLVYKVIKIIKLKEK